ncbi:HesA/MoeB/ThiF family protein [Pelotomaculum propionicicum]|uniref:HesA/MoeB/ThiF family protein n=1 Tax=Pelotomaculum propionicicum TaxID=258475 RepID=UPI003B7C9FF2
MTDNNFLTEEQAVRYHRNILLEGVGRRGQEKLLSAGVLLVGAGGLGSPAAFYLAAAGVGRIGLIDNDTVSLSNLQRQILHTTPDLDHYKVVSAAEKLKALNPALNIEPYQERFTENLARELIEKYDFVIDCTDNYKSRYIINENCVRLNIPFVYGGVLAWSGQAFTVVPGRGPCFKCIFPVEPPPDAPTTTELGVLGAVPGVIGTIQAAEAVRFILGVGELLVGRMLVYSALQARFFEVPVERSTDCPVCGKL